MLAGVRMERRQAVGRTTGAAVIGRSSGLSCDDLADEAHALTCGSDEIVHVAPCSSPPITVAPPAACSSRSRPPQIIVLNVASHAPPRRGPFSQGAKAIVWKQ